MTREQIEVKDREGYNYIVPGTPEWGRRTIVSPARRAQKALGLSGRQRVKFRKLQRRRLKLASQPKTIEGR